MKRFLIFSAAVVMCGYVAFHFFRPDFSWDADASGEESGPIANMNQPLPHAVLPTPGNEWVDLSGFKGKVVFITFWTTWCPGCVDEVPSLIHLQEEFGPMGFTVVAIAVDDQGEESVESFVQTRRFPVNGTSTAIDYPVLLGSDEVARKLGFEGGLPAGVLVNRDGQEVKIIRGEVSEASLSKVIRRLL